MSTTLTYNGVKLENVRTKRFEERVVSQEIMAKARRRTHIIRVVGECAGDLEDVRRSLMRPDRELAISTFSDRIVFRAKPAENISVRPTLASMEQKSGAELLEVGFEVEVREEWRPGGFRLLAE